LVKPDDFQINFVFHRHLPGTRAPNTFIAPSAFTSTFRLFLEKKEPRILFTDTKWEIPMKPRFLLVAATALLIGATSYGQEAVKDPKKAAKSTATATENAAKKTAHETEKVADATVSGTKKAAKATADGTAKAAHETGSAMKEIGHNTEEAAGATASGTKKAADATVSGTKKAAKATADGTVKAAKKAKDVVRHVG
jgi:hypothetical protein